MLYQLGYPCPVPVSVTSPECQHCTWLFSHTLYQLSYPCPALLPLRNISINAPGFSVKCSTNWAIPALPCYLSVTSVSMHLAFQSNALPTELSPSRYLLQRCSLSAWKFLLKGKVYNNKKVSQLKCSSIILLKMQEHAYITDINHHTLEVWKEHRSLSAITRKEKNRWNEVISTSSSTPTSHTLFIYLPLWPSPFSTYNV